ncbi:MAG: DUF3087 domain-containing protein [Thiopseudomonas sp.]|nr:DUF3087 domain-containing protein [Thiopseudomonas sp.]MCK9464896.1 DUF3087 domain-containing protein [Thiopseudomonas sp.]
MVSSTHKVKGKGKNIAPFTIAGIAPEDYRKQTRKSSMIIIIVFAASAMLFSSLLVLFFGDAENSNFKWNITGVILGVTFTAILTTSYFKKLPWMAASIYGWRLKRSLMSVTNIMHHVKIGVSADDPTAIKAMRFYHLGLLHMHKLDGNPSQDAELISEINQLQDKMHALQIDLQQNTLEPDWILQIKATYPAK